MAPCGRRSGHRSGSPRRCGDAAASAGGRRHSARTAYHALSRRSALNGSRRAAPRTGRASRRAMSRQARVDRHAARGAASDQETELEVMARCQPPGCPSVSGLRWLRLAIPVHGYPPSPRALFLVIHRNGAPIPSRPPTPGTAGFPAVPRPCRACRTTLLCTVPRPHRRRLRISPRPQHPPFVERDMPFRLGRWL